MSWVVSKVPSGRSPSEPSEPCQVICQVTLAESSYGVPFVARR